MEQESGGTHEPGESELINAAVEYLQDILKEVYGSEALNKEQLGEKLVQDTKSIPNVKLLQLTYGLKNVGSLIDMLQELLRIGQLARVLKNPLGYMEDIAPELKRLEDLSIKAPV